MIRKLNIIAVAGLALSACNNEPIRGEGPPDPMASELANAAPVELPPAISASKIYRCKDNSTVQIDWLADNSAYIHGNGLEQTRVAVAPPLEGKPASTDLVAEGGYVLKGNATAPSINVTLPGKGARVCHV